MPRKKPKADKPKPADAAATVLSRHGLYLVGGLLVWRPENDVPRGKCVAKIAELVEEDDGLGSEETTRWEFPLTDVSQLIVRYTWLERRLKSHIVGLAVKSADGTFRERFFEGRWNRKEGREPAFEDGTPINGDERGEVLFAQWKAWRVRQPGKWKLWNEGQEFPDSPQGITAPIDADPMREYWWTASGRHREQPGNPWFARTTYFRAGETALLRQDVLVIPPAPVREPLSAALKRLARTWQEKPWPDPTVEHPDSTPTHMRRVPNPVFWRRQGVVAGLHQLAHGLESGMDPERLVRLALGVGADLAKLGQEPLIPALKHGQALRSKNQGRSQSQAVARMNAALEEFVRSAWMRNPAVKAAAIQQRLTTGKDSPFQKEPDTDGIPRFSMAGNYWDPGELDSPAWTIPSLRSRIHEMLKKLNTGAG